MLAPKPLLSGGRWNHGSGLAHARQIRQTSHVRDVPVFGADSQALFRQIDRPRHRKGDGISRRRRLCAAVEYTVFQLLEGREI